MAAVLYQCQSCGGVHETMLRAGGAAYLRCVVTHEWAWHSPEHFLPRPGPAVRGGAATRSQEQPKVPGGGRAPAAKAARPRKAAARASRSAARKPARAGSGRKATRKASAAKRRRR